MNKNNMDDDMDVENLDIADKEIEDMFLSYATDNTTDLWDKIEKGISEETIEDKESRLEDKAQGNNKIIKFATRFAIIGSAIAAALLIIILVVPIFSVTKNIVIGDSDMLKDETVMSDQNTADEYAESVGEESNKAADTQSAAAEDSVSSNSSSAAAKISVYKVKFKSEMDSDGNATVQILEEATGNTADAANYIHIESGSEIAVTILNSEEYIDCNGEYNIYISSYVTLEDDSLLYVVNKLERLE